VNPRNLVVVLDLVVPEGDIGRAHHQNALIQGIAHRESSDGHVIEAWVVIAVDKEAVGEIGCVHDRGMRTCSNNGNRKSHVNLFVVGPWTHMDGVIGSGMAQRIRDCRIAAMLARRIHAKGFCVGHLGQAKKNDDARGQTQARANSCIRHTVSSWDIRRHLHRKDGRSRLGLD